MTFNEKGVKNNQNFWSTVIPLRSNKFVYSEKITLIENEKIITDFKRFFLKYTVLEIQFSSVNYTLVNYTQAVLIAAFKAETVYNSLKVNKTF